MHMDNMSKKGTVEFFFSQDKISTLTLECILIS